MSTIATLAVKLIGDITDFTAKMNQAQSEAQVKAGLIGAAMQDIGTAMTGMGRGLTVGLTLPILAAGGAAVKWASDLEETRNKASVVFGDMAQSVLDWSVNSAIAFGMSREQALAAAATYGNLFVTMGMGQKPAAEMSTSLVQLAADLASFNNANPADVLAAMQSGLVGQVEPLRKYGVVLSEAAVQAKAMELGLLGVDGKLSEAAKLQARYAIIMEQTGTAQGDFARTADGMANSMRTVKAQLADAGAALGQQLLPYVLRGAQFVSRLIEKFQALSPAAQKWIMIFLGIAAVVGPVLVIVGPLITAIGAIIPVVTAVAGAIGGALSAAAAAVVPVILPIIAVVAAVVAVIALLAAAWKGNWFGIRDALTNAWNAILPVFQMLYTWFQNYLANAIVFYSALWNQVLLPAIQIVWDFIANTLWPLFVAVANFLGAVFGLVLTVLAAIWQNILLPAITAVWGFIANSLWPLFMAVANFLGAVFGVALTILAGIWQNVLLPAIQKVLDGFTLVYTWIAEKLHPIFETLSTFVNDKVMPAIQALGEWLSDHLAPAFQAVANVVSSIITWLETLTTKLKNIKLPAWMMPGSPTPWEVGLVGIDGAMKKLVGMRLPSLQTQLNMLPGEMPMAGYDAWGGMMGANNYAAVAGAGNGFAPVVVNFTYAPMMSMADEYEAENVLGPLIGRQVRKALGES